MFQVNNYNFKIKFKAQRVKEVTNTFLEWVLYKGKGKNKLIGKAGRLFFFSKLSISF